MKNNDTNVALNFEEDSNEDGRNNPANEWKLVVSKKKLPNNHGNAKFKKPQRKSYTNIAH